MKCFTIDGSQSIGLNLPDLKFGIINGSAKCIFQALTVDYTNI